MTGRILIMDEDRKVLEGLCGALKGAGRPLEVHTSSEAAWASIDRDPPDVVILGARTAGLFGHPLVDDLRTHFGERVSMVVADSPQEESPDGAPAGRVVGREAHLCRSLDHHDLVQRAVCRLLKPDRSDLPEIEAEGWEAAPIESRPLWETPAVELLEQLLDGIVIADARGDVVYLNSAAAQLLGVSASEVLQRPLAEVPAEAGIRQLLESAQRGEGQLGQSVCVPRAHGEGVIEVRIARLEEEGGGGSGWFVGLHDISEQVRVDRLRGHYLTVVAHELRTPMTVLNNLISLMAPSDSDLGAAAHQQVRRLEHQVDKLLLLARRGRGAEVSETEIFDLRSVVRDAVDVSQAQAEEEGTAFRLLLPDHPVRVEAGMDDTRRALHELAENAVKFTPRGGVVSVRIEEGPTWIEVAVQDTGIGIEPASHEAIFDEFRQLEQPVTRSHGGAGLGLALARGLIESWGGTIRVQSEPGAGSTFTLGMPRASEASTAELREEEGAMALSGTGENDHD